MDGGEVDAVDRQGPEPAVRPGVLHAEVEDRGVREVAAGVAVQLLRADPEAEHLASGRVIELAMTAR